MIIGDEEEDIDTIEVRRVRPEKTSPVVNAYTYGMVRNIGNARNLGNASKDGLYTLGKILIDGSSMTNIMALYLAEGLEPDLILTTGLAIRTATTHITRIDWQCLLDITIAGVTATATVYCILEPSCSSYTLLLGRRWWSQCKAIG